MAKPETARDTKLPVMENTSSLDELQSQDQRAMLNAVGQLRHKGLESLIPLPQIVVCGDQSAGKSSVLEAISEIPFPRNYNLCTRFATEIVLRHAQRDTITVKIIPSDNRTKDEQDAMRGFCEFILEFNELPSLVEKAMTVMGIGNGIGESTSQAFAKDVLSITIEGPSRAHLTLVDLPGLIQTQSRGVTAEDIKTVKDITDHYIAQPRTIILAVVSAAYDHPCQGILQKVLSQGVDPDGKRTLGLITKPDRLASGSGAEKAYLDLAANKDRFLHLGWHVLKNRTYEEGEVSFEERNTLEAAFFSTSNFNTLDDGQLGIATLRKRLSDLLFEHVKREMPKLQVDLERALEESAEKLRSMGNPRVTEKECRDYLMVRCHAVEKTCTAALNGNYMGDFFDKNQDLRRLRAAVQKLNVEFAAYLRKYGHKYQFNQSFGDTSPNLGDTRAPILGSLLIGVEPINAPKSLSKAETLSWVKGLLDQTRGRELPGNSNALVVGELFWKQSEKWKAIAKRHLWCVSRLCIQFLRATLAENCAKHVQDALWTAIVKVALSQRFEAAEKELDSLAKDLKDFPINYNHYYTDTKRKRRLEREKPEIANCIKRARTSGPNAFGTPGFSGGIETIDEVKAVENISLHIDPNMDNHACEDAMDSLMSIYKLSQKTFVANVTTQVIERHIVRGLEEVFSTLTVNEMADKDILRIASEPQAAQKQRQELKDRVQKLRDGYEVLQDLIGSTAF